MLSPRGAVIWVFPKIGVPQNAWFIMENHYLIFEPKQTKRVFPNIGVPQNGWFILENPIKMDDLGVALIFLETPISSTPYPFFFAQSDWVGNPDTFRSFVDNTDLGLFCLNGE